MLLGGAGRSVRKAVMNVRRSINIKNSAPGGTGGSTGGSGSGIGGGSGGNLTPADDGDSGDGANPLVTIWKNYEALLEEKPLLMKALTSFTGFAIGDILAQTFIQKQKLDWSAHACRRPV
jgi:protein Mpv17